MSEIHALIPEGFHIMHAESTPTKGGFHWIVWLRQDKWGEWKGGQGFTLQEAVDNAERNLRKALASVQPKPVAGVTISLADLGIKI